MNNTKKGAKGTRRSFFLNGLNAFTSFLYSIFTNGRIGRALASDDKLYKQSRLADTFERKPRTDHRGARYVEMIVEKSRVLSTLGLIKTFLVSLSLNIYGIFMMVYGITAVFMYYISIAINGTYSNGNYAVITPIIMIFCAIPMLFSTSGSVANTVSKSHMMKKITLSFLGIPEEKLNIKNVIGGTEFMFMASVIAVLFGTFTYFLHPAYFPVLFGVIVVVCLIAANPETGIIFSVTAVPFLQYTKHPTLVISAMILATMISYSCKLIRRRRTAHIGVECILMFIFCGFMLAGSIFSPGGFSALMDAMFSVLIIIGGFLLTYNLICARKHLEACSKILIVAFTAVCVFGIWNLIYNQISVGFIYSIRESVSPILNENNIIYIADKASVFSAMSVLIFPLFLSYTARQKKFKNVALMIVASALVVITTFIYGTYEAVVALAIEFILFWLLYSHKSMTVMILTLIPIGIFMVVYPYLEIYFGWENISDIVKNILPLNDPDSAIRTNLARNVTEMLKDGNFSGIGVGQDTFESVFPAYSDVVSQGATDPGSLWLQILCWSGVGGVITFIIFAMIMIKKGLGYMTFSREKQMKGNELALLCGFAVALIFGSVNCVWEDSKILYLFWFCAGLLAAYIKNGRDAENIRVANFAYSEENTDIELRFTSN